MATLAPDLYQANSKTTTIPSPKQSAASGPKLEYLPYREEDARELKPKSLFQAKIILGALFVLFVLGAAGAAGYCYHAKRRSLVKALSPPLKLFSAKGSSKGLSKATTLAISEADTAGATIPGLLKRVDSAVSRHPRLFATLAAVLLILIIALAVTVTMLVKTANIPIQVAEKDVVIVSTPTPDTTSFSGFAENVLHISPSSLGAIIGIAVFVLSVLIITPILVWKFRTPVASPIQIQPVVPPRPLETDFEIVTGNDPEKMKAYILRLFDDIANMVPLSNSSWDANNLRQQSDAPNNFGFVTVDEYDDFEKISYIRCKEGYSTSEYFYDMLADRTTLPPILRGQRFILIVMDDEDVILNPVEEVHQDNATFVAIILNPFNTNDLDRIRSMFRQLAFCGQAISAKQPAAQGPPQPGNDQSLHG